MPPTVPAIETAPAPVKVKFLAPLTVLDKVIAPPFAMTSPVKFTGPVSPIARGVLEVRLPPKLIAVGAV